MYILENELCVGETVLNVFFLRHLPSWGGNICLYYHVTINVYFLIFIQHKP